MAILFKDASVKIRVLSPALMHIFNTLVGLNQENIPIYPKDWVITSVNDGTHMKNSRHYSNEAIDMRSKNFRDTNVKNTFAALLELRLGKKFSVLLEHDGKPNQHFHIQVKKGGTFP